MVFHPPPGFRFARASATSAPPRGAELSLRGSAAGSHIGDGVFYAPITHAFLFDHHLEILDNTNEQITLVQSEGWTVLRGKINAIDNSIEFNSPTCFPAPPQGVQCADDYVLQLGVSTTLPPYTRAAGNYATTPPTCPAEGYWTTTVRFWWADGTTDSVDTRQPCTA